MDSGWGTREMQFFLDLRTWLSDLMNMHSCTLLVFFSPASYILVSVISWRQVRKSKQKRTEEILFSILFGIRAEIRRRLTDRKLGIQPRILPFTLSLSGIRFYP